MIKKYIIRFLLPFCGIGFIYVMSRVPKMLQVFGVVPANKSAVAATSKEDLKKQLNGESGAVMKEGKKMVFINGKYYPYREDGRYETDTGERVLYVDNSAQRRLAEENKESSSEQTVTGKMIESLKPDVGNLELGDLETLRKAQEFLKERNSYLKELSEGKD